MRESFSHLDTRLIRSGEQNRVLGSLAYPIFQSAMFENEGVVDYDDEGMKLHFAPGGTE